MDLSKLPRGSKWISFAFRGVLDMDIDIGRNMDIAGDVGQMNYLDACDVHSRCV